MEIGKENEGEMEKLASNSLVSFRVVLREDIVNLQDFIERLNSGPVQTSLDMDQIEKLTLKLTFLSAFCHLYYSFFLESCNDEMSSISNEIHDLVQSLFHPSGEDMLVNIKYHALWKKIKSYISSHSYAEPSHVTVIEDRLVELLDAILMYLQCLLKFHAELTFPSMTQYELLQNVFGNLRDFHRLKVNDCVEYQTIEYVLPQFQLMAERVGHFCFTFLDFQLDEFDESDVSRVNSKLANLLVEVIPVELEVMHICCTNLKGSKSEEVGRFIKQLLEASPDILRVSLIHLQEHMVNALTPSASTCNIHVMIEFLLIILTDVLKDVIRHDKLFVLLARVIELTKEVFVLVRNLEENMNEASDANLNLLENIELLKEDLKNDFLKDRADSSQLCFPMSDGPLFMTLLLRNLNNLANSNASSVALIKEKIKQVKEDLEIIRSLFGYVEQELHRDLWTRVLDVAYEAEHAINSILAQDHGLLQLIFILPDTVEKIKLVKREVQEKIPKSRGIIVANAPTKPVVRNSSSTVGKIIVGFEEETEWIIRKLTRGPAEIDVISIVGMPGIGKTTLAYRVYNRKSIVYHFDVCAWCTVGQEHNEKKLLQKIFNQVIGLKEQFNEDHDIDDDIADKLRKQLFGKRYLIVLDDMWDTATLDELTRPFPELRKGSRVILTSRKKEVALHGKCHSDPLYLRLLRSNESWKLLEKRVFGEERCPDELKDVGEEIARKCDGLPLVLDLIGGVISRKEKKVSLWLEVLNNLSSFIYKDEEEVVKVIQLSYDHLSDHVKPCFVCLARYPKNKNIRISELKDLWISQGFVQHIVMRSAEEVVDELISSSLVIPFDNSICKIHDLVHDFCYKNSRKEKLLHFLGGSKAPSSSSSGMMARGITIRYDQGLFDLDEGQTKGEDNKSLVSSVVLRGDIVNLQDFIERVNSGGVQTSFDLYRIEELTLKLTFVSTFCRLYYSLYLESCNDEMSCITNEIHDLVQSLFHPSGVDMLVSKKFYHLLEYIRSYISSHIYAEPSRVTTMTEDRLVELLDAIHMYLQSLLKCCSESIFPSMTQYERLQNVFGNLRDFHRLKVNGCVEYEMIEYVLPHLQLMALRVVNFCFTFLDCQVYKFDESDVSRVDSKLANLLVEVIPVELEVMHICCTNLKGSKSEEVGRFIKQLLEASPYILRVSLIHLQEHMVNALTPSASTCNIHVMIEFLLIILTDVLKDIIRHDKLFVLLARVIELTKEVFVLVRNIEENMNEASDANLNLMENIELLKKDLKNDFLKSRADSSQLCFPMSDGPLFMTLLLTNLNDLANSNASSVAFIKKEIKQLKEDLEIIRSLFGYVEQELHRDLWTRVLDVAYEAEHAIHSILARDYGLLQLIFILPDTVEKIKLVKKEVQEKIPKSSGIIVANAPNKLVDRNSSSTVGKIIVGFEEETELIIKKLTSGPAEIDVISIVGMPGIGKTTLAYRVYNDESIVDHFDVCAWCTVDQERNEKKLLQNIFNQVIGLKERFSEDHDIDDDVADKLRKKLCAQRYLIVLDDMWDTATFDELMRPFPEFQKGSRVILTSRKKEVALHGKCHSDPLYLRLLRSEESWELLEKRVFGEERCPDELKDVGEKIARKCDGLPLVLDLIGGVISRKEKKEALWLEVLNNLSSFIFKDEEEVVKVIQLSYDHLSDHVKPCFVCLASYPKDEDIRISELKDLWISQGLVEQIEMKSAEEVVDELISSSLVIPFDNSICKIHDLVHDFCYIKYRKEKLLHVLGGSKAPSSSSSSSDLMPRGIIIRFSTYIFRLNETFVMFDPEKKNPCVEHLLTLKVYKDCLPHKSHLKHLRLLKSLDLKGITLTDSLLNEIGMLIHLKYLIIQTQANTLPPSFSNLCNLETLVVDHSEGSCMILSPCLWSLAKLRDVRMNGGALFHPDITVLDEDSRLENLRTLSQLYLSVDLEDIEDIIFKRFPKLQNLEVCIRQLPDCSAEEICFPRLDVLNELEQLRFSASSWDSFPEYTHGFPLSLKKLMLQWLALTSDSLSRIARLPNLEELILEDTIIEEAEEWEDVTFQNLKSLKLVNVEFSEWQVDAEKSFPVLEKLHIRTCDKLMDIPDSFGDIASLELIKVRHSPQLKESILKIKEYVEEMTGEDKLQVDFDNDPWYKQILSD